MVRASADFQSRVSFGILVVLLASTPATIVANDALLQHVVTILVLLALTIATTSARSFDIIRLLKVIRPIAILLALPAAWMMIQAIPIPIGRLTHPVWISAANYLGDQATGYISVDQGRTIACLFAYGSGVAAILLTILLTRDRRQAEQILLALNGVTVTTVLLLLVIVAGHFVVLKDAGGGKDLLLLLSSLGIIFNLASAARLIERRSISFGDNALRKRMLGLMACAVGAAACLVAFASFANVNLAIVCGCGIMTFAAIQLFRRVKVAPWSIGLFLILGGAAAVAAMWRNTATPGVAFVLQFAAMPPGDPAATVQRILADTSALGNGAGTFAALFPMYRTAGQILQAAPTTATALTIEWGLPAVFVLFAATLWLVFLLVHGALSRGRDSFYSATAASCAVILLGHALCNATISQPAVMLLGEVAIGLGLAQRLSRTG